MSVFDKHSNRTEKLHKIFQVISLLIPQLTTLLLHHSPKYTEMVIQRFLVVQMNMRMETAIPIITPINHSTDTAMQQAHSTHNAGLAGDNNVIVSAEIGIFFRSSLSTQLHSHSLALVSDSGKAAVVQKHALSAVSTLPHDVAILVQNHHSHRKIAVQRSHTAKLDRKAHGGDVPLLLLVC